MNSLENRCSNLAAGLQLGIVIVNWNGFPDLVECLTSVVRSTYANMKVVVVDNGSVDGTIKSLPLLFPNVELIATGANLGWAGGNNVGIKHALDIGCSYVLLLNNDTTISADCTALLMNAVTSARIDILHPSIYYYDNPAEAQLDPVINLPGVDRGQLVEIDYTYGAALLLSADLIKKVGFFDERFFLQMEEADFFQRARTYGVKSYVIPQARVLHKESRSFGAKITPIKSYYIVRNSLLLLSKHSATLGGWPTGLRNLYWTVSNMIGNEADKDNANLLFKLRFLLSNNATSKAIRYGIKDFVLGRFGSISSKVAEQVAVSRRSM